MMSTIWLVVALVSMICSGVEAQTFRAVTTAEFGAYSSATQAKLNSKQPTGTYLTPTGSGAGLTGITPQGIGGREVLTGNRTYYIATTGNDTNGTGASGAPWATLQKASDHITSRLDVAGYTVTINIADGTYSGLATKGFSGGGGVVFQGNTTNMDAVVINSGYYIGGFSGAYQIAYQKLHGITGDAIYCGTPTVSVAFGNINFGTATGHHITAYTKGAITSNANYSISGSAGGSHYRVGYGGLLFDTNRTIAVSPGLTFPSGFTSVDSGSILRSTGNTFSTNVATGIRFSITGNSIVDTFGAGSTYFPGDNTGTTATGGIYQ